MSTMPAQSGTPLERLRARCAEMGLLTWRAQASGAIVEGPSEAGELGRLMRARPFTGAVRSAAAAWANRGRAGVTCIAPGAWAVPVTERTRRGVAGFLIVVVLGPEFLASPLFDAICAGEGMDGAATRAHLEPEAKHSERSALCIDALLARMAADLADLQDQQVAIGGFTTQLTDSYETIEALYSIGRSMGQITRPDAFVRETVDRLHAMMSFGWLAVRFGSAGGLPRELRRWVYTVGETPEMLRLPPRDEEVAACLGATGGALILMAEPGELSVAGRTEVLCQPLARDGRLIGHLLAGAKRGLDTQLSSYDTRLFEAVGIYLNAFLENASLYADVEQMFLGTLQALTASIDAKDRYTRGHSERVALVAAQLAAAVGFEPGATERVRIAGLVHDVGKIGVPEAVLTKQGRLSPEEFEAIKRHPEIGRRILQDIPGLQDVLPGVLHHHERWDGRGYPFGLRGQDIPLIARLITVADTFDAMSSNRSYRPALGRERVLAEMGSNAGIQFDPELVRAFLGLDLKPYDELAARETELEGSPELRPVEGDAGKAAA